MHEYRGSNRDYLIYLEADAGWVVVYSGGVMSRCPGFGFASPVRFLFWYLGGWIPDLRGLVLVSFVWGWLWPVEGLSSVWGRTQSGRLTNCICSSM